MAESPTAGSAQQVKGGIEVEDVIHGSRDWATILEARK